MIKSAVTISLVPEARGGPFVYWDDLAKGVTHAAKLGFDAVELFAPGAGAVPMPLLQELLAENNLKLAAAGTGAGWVKHRMHLTHENAAVRSAARKFIMEIIDFAAVFEAPAIIGSMQGKFEGNVTREQALEWLREELNELGDHAVDREVPLLYEPLNRYETNLFNRVSDAVDFLKTLKTHNVKLLADLFHMNIEEASIADALRAGGKHIGHLHFVDSNRRPAGCGHIDYAPIAQALADIEYDGYASAEVLPYPDSEAAARQTIDKFRQVFRAKAT